MEQQKIDLDALEAALGKATPGEWWADKTTVRTHDGMPIAFCAGTTGSPYDERTAAHFIALAHNALPALIAELRELRARTTPEVIGDKHRDGGWWLLWHENIGAWCKARWDLGCGQWDFEGYVWFERTPTHALPLPPAPEAR